MKLEVFEVVEKASKAKGPKEKVAVLTENKSGALGDLMQGTYDPRIVWLLPQGDPPPYTPANPRAPSSPFIRRCVDLKYFVQGGGFEHLLSARRERIFINMLESIHPRDALLVLNMVNKKPIPGIPESVAREAFPERFAK